MKVSLLNWLSCPKCKGNIILEGGLNHKETTEIETGSLKCALCGDVFLIVNSIPRFIREEGYTNNFGFQWNLFRKTQLDSYTNTTISKDRFFRESKWNPEQMKGKLIIDAGCGAGRFAEIALSTETIVFAVDYSNAVDACWKNLKNKENLHVVQADIYNLPFRSDTFDYIYSFGVLHHTPNVKKSFFSLIQKLKNGGKICVDFYRKDWKIYLWSKYWLRPILKNLPQEKLLKIIKKVSPVLLLISNSLNRIPKIGHYLKYAIPVVNHKGELPLNKELLFEWTILNTFDMFSPKYDNPQNEKEVSGWLTEANLSNIEVLNQGLVVARGTK